MISVSCRKAHRAGSLVTAATNEKPKPRRGGILVIKKQPGTGML